MFVQAILTARLEPSPPLSERRSRDAAAATDETGIEGTLIKLYPLQTGVNGLLNIAHAST